MTKNKPFLPFIALHIIPTGIGATIGGFAGDAGPANALIASSADIVICNTNIINAATLHNLPDNCLYTEGYLLDLFCKGEIFLEPVRSNKIGVVFDKAIPLELLNININAINACRTVYGIDISGYTITEKPVGVKYYRTEENISTGTIENPDTLLSACSKLIANGAKAVAVVCMFPVFRGPDNYSNGQDTDPIAGVESIISHLVCQEFKIPSAHAPAFTYEDSLPSTEIVDPRAASEYFSPTYLPCVLAGLSAAPAVLESASKSSICFNDVDILITPYNCLGSIPVLVALENNIKICAVKNNHTVLDITAEKLCIKDKVIEVENYLEACGLVMALKNNISPETLIRPVQILNRI